MTLPPKSIQEYINDEFDKVCFILSSEKFRLKLSRVTLSTVFYLLFKLSTPPQDNILICMSKSLMSKLMLNEMLNDTLMGVSHDHLDLCCPGVDAAHHGLALHSEGPAAAE